LWFPVGEGEGNLRRWRIEKGRWFIEIQRGQWFPGAPNNLENTQLAGYVRGQTQGQNNRGSRDIISQPNTPAGAAKSGTVSSILELSAQINR